MPTLQYRRGRSLGGKKIHLVYAEHILPDGKELYGYSLCGVYVMIESAALLRMVGGASCRRCDAAQRVDAR